LCEPPLPFPLDDFLLPILDASFPISKLAVPLPVGRLELLTLLIPPGLALLPAPAFKLLKDSFEFHIARTLSRRLYLFILLFRFYHFF
jgi:hypothetical protein